MLRLNGHQENPCRFVRQGLCFGGMGYTERYCRSGEGIGDTGGCPVNGDGRGICSGIVRFRLTAKTLGNENFYRGGFSEPV